MDSAWKRGLVGGVGAVLWLVGATATAPLADGHPLFGLAQVVIDTSPGWVATTVIETLGKAAQPMLVGLVGVATVAIGVVTGVLWSRLPTPVRKQPVGLAVVLLAVTAATFALANVRGGLTLVGVTVLTVAPVLLFGALLATGGLPLPGDQREAAGRRPFLQGTGVALAGALGVGAVTRVTAPDESESGETKALPPASDSSDGDATDVASSGPANETPKTDSGSGSGSETQTDDGTDKTDEVTETSGSDPVTEKQEQGTTVTPGSTATATPTRELVRKDSRGPMTVSEVEGGGEFGFDFAGMPKRVTPPEAHYVVDKNVDDPEIDREQWSLSVGGTVDSPYELGFDDLTGHEDSLSKVVTMVCISNRVGDDLISTGKWRGIPLRTLVQRAGPGDNVTDVVTKSPDGYSEALPWSYVKDHPEVLLVYGLGGRTLSTKHGAPARLLVPGRYGMKSTKWVNEIELSRSEHVSYWHDRGWDEEAVVHTLSYIRAVQRRGDRVAVGGIAYAGLRGIQSVEVSLDGGDTWAEAELAEPTAELAWRHWRHVVERSPGEIDVVTRATDGTGERQTSDPSPPHPGGSTGYHRVSFDI